MKKMNTQEKAQEVVLFSNLTQDKIRTMKAKDIREARRLETNMQIAKMRADGIRVHIRHKRMYKYAIVPVAQVPYVLANIEATDYLDSLFVKAEVLSPNGGDTYVELETATGMKFIGKAHCTRQDRFNKTEGIILAFNRASKELAKAVKVPSKKKTSKKKAK